MPAVPICAASSSATRPKPASVDNASAAASPRYLPSSTSKRFAAAMERARRPGAELLAKANEATAEHGVPAETRLRGVMRATVADAIVDEAQKLGCDLIVMGTHGRRGISR